MLLRLNILLLMSVCCYGLQALMEKQRRAEEESEEFTMRQSQLEAAGRLAAEIAHQIKNPLGIINTAAYSLQKALAAGRAGRARADRDHSRGGEPGRPDHHRTDGLRPTGRRAGGALERAGGA